MTHGCNAGFLLFKTPSLPYKTLTRLFNLSVITLEKKLYKDLQKGCILLPFFLFYFFKAAKRERERLYLSAYLFLVVQFLFAWNLKVSV